MQQRVRENTYFVLMGCERSFENCFCVSMGSNRSEHYDMSIDRADGGFRIDVNKEEWNRFFCEEKQEEVVPAFVTENPVKVTLPKSLTNEAAKASLWHSYDGRCIRCGRCTVVCPTCTCYTMQDIYYSENGKAGERRRLQHPA